MSTPIDTSKEGKEIIKDYNRKARLKRLAHHLAVSMSLISGSTVRGSLSDSLQVPAATHVDARAHGYGKWLSPKGKKVRDSYRTMFNPYFLPEDDLQVWLGIAWHELGHVLWSPYDSGVNITIAMNLLEDARVETLLLLKYPKMRAALMSGLLKLLTDGGENNTSDPAYSYAWVAGRSHLSSDVRKKARKMLVANIDNGDRIANVIDRIFKEYVGMGSNLDIKEAKDLADELEHILGMKAHSEIQHTCNGTQAGGNLDRGEQPEVDVPDDVVDNIGSGEDTEDDTDTQSTASGAGSTTSESEDTEDDTGTPTQVDANDITQARIDTTDLKEDVKKEIGEQASNVSAELEQEIAKLEQLIDMAGGSQGAEIDVAYDPPAPTDRQIANEIRRAALKFNDESGKGLVRRRDHGRFKPSRFERYDDLDTAYDQWEPGLEQEMYIALLMDISGSMRTDVVTQVLYALEMGLRDVATIDIALFNEQVRVPGVTNTDTRRVVIRCGGGTDPSDGLSYLHPRIKRASAANRLLVVYTDGIFNHDESYAIANAYFQDLKRDGVNVRMLADPRADLSKLELQMPSLSKGTDLREIATVQELPKVVLEWTQTILQGAIL